MAIGNGNKAYGNTSFATGQLNTATGNLSFVGGNNNYVSGQQSIVWGKDISTQNARGITIGLSHYSEANNNYNAIFGNTVKLSTWNEYNLIQGQNIELASQNRNNLIVGNTIETIESVNNSIIIGNEQHLQSSNFAAIFGDVNSISGAQHSLVQGTENIISGPANQYNVIFGTKNSVINSTKHNLLFGKSIQVPILSNYNVIFGEAHDLGEEWATHNIIAGYSNTLSSTATQKVRFSSTFGYKNDVKAQYSFSAGSNLIAKNTYGAYFGHGNIGKDDTIFEIGQGHPTVLTSRENIFEVTKTGVARAYGTPIANNDVLRWQEKVALEQQLASEAQARENSAADLSNLIAAETQRAQEIEQNISDNLSIERARITNAESDISELSNFFQLIEYGVTDVPWITIAYCKENPDAPGSPGNLVATYIPDTINGWKTAVGAATISCQVNFSESYNFSWEDNWVIVAIITELDVSSKIRNALCTYSLYSYTDTQSGFIASEIADSGLTVMFTSDGGINHIKTLNFTFFLA